jgi:protein ImuB
LGVTTLGSLAGLPRDAVASRFGAVGLAAHRLSRGEDRPVDPRGIPPELAVESRWEEPLELTDQVAFAARALAVKLMARLLREGIAPHRVVVEVETDDGEIRSRVWRSSDPFTEEALSERVRWQMQAWVGERRRSRGGIVRMRLDPFDLSGEGRQLGLFTDESARVEAERALARVQTLVGPDGVLEAVAQGGRMPADQVAWHRWQEEPVTVRDPGAPWPGATPAPSPALVPSEQQRVDVEWDGGLPVRIRLGTRWEPILTWAGPWRMTGSWWVGGEPVDRYQLVTSAGAFLCVVRNGTTFLTGIYD